jgi:4'-phosphopantetheinyl transferase
MLGKHVAALDIDCLANSVWHLGEQIDLPLGGKRNFWFPRAMLWRKTDPNDDLGETEVHLWRVGLDASGPALAKLRETLSGDEVQRGERFRFPELQRRFVAGRGALRLILGGYLSVDPRRIDFGYTAHGKPFLKDPPGGIQFNLSHSGGLMVAAICRTWRIGVDIEKEDPRFDARQIAERYFCAAERNEIAKSRPEDQFRAFFRLWTAKEALLKGTSLGLTSELHQAEVSLAPLRVVTMPGQEAGENWQLAAFDPGEGYSGSLAVAGTASGRDFRELDFSA